MKFFFTLLSLVVCLGLSAQNTAERDVDQVVAEYTAQYQLTEAQQAEMRVIEERRRRNLAEIAPLETTDHHRFLAKRQALRRNTEGSIRRMLTPEQREIHDQVLIDRRIETSSLIKEWRAAGKSKEEIELLLLERG